MPKDYHLHLRGDVGGWDFNSGYVSYILDKNKDKQVNVLIDSLGGRVDTALSISSLFKIHGDVHVHFVGMNASAATIAAMGARHVSIDADACFLVHKCMNLVLEWDYMNADELEKHIAELRKMKDDQDTIDSCIAGIYARRCKKPKDELLSLMSKGGWLSPEQAKEWGFVDEITDFEEDGKPALTDAVASALCSAGIPMPPVPVTRDKASFFERLRNFFSDSLNSQPSSLNSQPSSSDMDKYKLIASILGGALAVSGAGLTLTADQLDKVETSLKDKDAEIESLKAQIKDKDSDLESLRKTVDDLKKSPAAATTDVAEQQRGSESTGPGDDIDTVVNQLADAFCH